MDRLGISEAELTEARVQLEQRRQKRDIQKKTVNVCGTNLAFVSTQFRSRRSLQLEVAALRHQLTVYQRAAQRPQINPGDRVLWSWIARHWSGWRRDRV